MGEGKVHPSLAFFQNFMTDGQLEAETLTVTQTSSTVLLPVAKRDIFNATPK